MKKCNKLVLSAIIAAAVFAPKAKALFGESANFDTVAFWQTTLNLLANNGYGAGTEYYRHANENLHRAETMHGKGKHHAAPKHKEAKSKKDQDAFKRGKKAGEAHERRVLKKKEAKKHTKPATTRTQTHKKKTKKVNT